MDYFHKLTILKRSLNLSLNLINIKGKYSRTPLIRKMVIRTANNPEWLRQSGKYFLTVIVLQLSKA